MNSHQHARLTPYGRALLVRRMLEEGLRAEEAAQAAGVSVRTAYKWCRRYLDEGDAGLSDRGSRPARCPHRTAHSLCERIIALRRERRTYRQIHACTGVSMATIGRVLQRAGLNRLSVLDPPRPVRRYAWDRPGQMLHVAVKKLGRFHRPGHRVTDSRRLSSRGAGWDYVHVAVDDASRLALSTVHADETGRSACRALIQAIWWVYTPSRRLPHARRPPPVRSAGCARRERRTAVRARARTDRRRADRRPRPAWSPPPDRRPVA